MNASTYLDQQLSSESQDGLTASAYLDAQLQQPKQDDKQSPNLTIMSNAPFSGLQNAATDTALGGTQALAGLLGHIPSLRHISVGGLDIGTDPVYQGINDMKKIKDEETSDAMQNDPVSKSLYTGGDIAGNMALFSALGGTSSPSTTGIQGLVSRTPLVGKAISGVMPAMDAGALSSYIQPAQDEEQRNTNAMVGGGISALASGLSNALSTQVTDPTKQAALKTAEDFDIPVYRTQLSDSKIPRALASFEKDIPFSGASGKVADQVAAFNNAVNGTIGQAGDAVTPEILGKANDEIGNVYKTMTSKYNLPVTSEFEDRLLNLNDAVPTLGDQGKEHALQSQVNNVMSKIKNGQIDGSTYQGIRSKIGGLLRGQNGSPELGQLQDLLDTQFQGGMSPEDAQIFQQARGQYRNMLALEKVVANNPNEAISPAKLQGAVKNVFGDYAYGGRSDLERLARLGNVLKDTFPDSGTATRTQLYELAKHIAGPAIGVGVGAGEGYHEGGLGGAAIGAVGGLAMNKALLNPYLYSSMSENPSMIQGAALANALYNTGRK